MSAPIELSDILYTCYLYNRLINRRFLDKNKKFISIKKSFQNFYKKMVVVLKRIIKLSLALFYKYFNKIFKKKRYTNPCYMYRYWNGN